MAAAEKQAPDRNLAMELVRVTEAAALAASRWMGRGDKNGADGAAVDAMRIVLDTVSMDGIVVIGEGEKDEAPMLYNGERIGDGSPPETDIAVDPVEGTTLTALGRGGAIAVIAVSERGTMVDPGPCVYMEKLALGPERPGIGAPTPPVSGIAATPAGGLAPSAMKCMGGEIQGRLWPRDDAERQAARDAGYDLDQVLGTDDLVKGDNAFFAATGITDGEVLKGVHYTSLGATTQSLVMRSKSGTVR